MREDVHAVHRRTVRQQGVGVPWLLRCKRKRYCWDGYRTTPPAPAVCVPMQLKSTVRRVLQSARGQRIAQRQSLVRRFRGAITQLDALDASALEKGIIRQRHMSAPRAGVPSRWGTATTNHYFEIAAFDTVRGILVSPSSLKVAMPIALIEPYQSMCEDCL